ncbi:MAG: helix-turn-helix transcriptional regulator [Bacteroidaceae bacterium]|nr:helix-turn-helix transcriptional regulator [Bacteroidaceae bacterium]
MIFSAFIIGAATAFFTIFALHILVFMPLRTRFQSVLGIIMAVWAVWCAKDLVVCMPGMYTQPVLDWILIIDGWSAITYTIFVFEVVMPGWTTWRRLLLLALPFLLFTVGYALWPVREVVYAYSVFLWFYAWTVVIVGWTRMNRYLRYISHEYSNIDKIDASWLRPVFLFTVIGQLVWLFISLYSNVISDIVYYIIIIALWLVMLHYSWNFQPIETPRPALEGEEEGEEGEAFLTETKKQLPFAGLEKLMEEEKYYLKPTLTLKELALDLNTNRTYISSYLNQQMNMTFYDYINNLRIERAALPLMREHPEYKYEYVAAESGFASISTFRRAFVKVTGQTPSQYAAALAQAVQ